jgi:hypothetical protein
VGSELLALGSHLDIMDDSTELNLSFLSALRCEMARIRSSSLFFFFLTVLQDQLQQSCDKCADLRGCRMKAECYKGRTYFTLLSNRFVGGSITDIFLAHFVYALVDFSSPAIEINSE